jgi:hypothetical protein
MTLLQKSHVEKICAEIEIQWKYLLITRAVFYSKFPEKDSYESPLFYQQRGFTFRVELPPMTDDFNITASGVAVWLNQNYVIRLFGILDSKKIIKYGIENGAEIIELIKILRNNVGAHSTGRQVGKRKTDLRKATLLINKLFGREIKLEDLHQFKLSIDSVLEPMKTQTIDYVKTLETKNPHLSR